jgi:hypothetical protein
VKLARVDHERCQEISASTYVWVRDDMTQKEFEGRVHAATRKYELALTELREHQADKPAFSPYSRPDWERERGRNVSEVLDEFAERQRVAKEREAKERAASGSFLSFLEDGADVRGFYDREEDILTDTVHWGHRHGVSIDYGETEVEDFVPIQGKKREREDW